MNGLMRAPALPWAKLPVLDLALAYVVARSIDWKFNAANALISPGGYNLVEAKASHLSVAVAAAALPFLLPARWRRWAWWAILGLFSALALVDLLYVRYFDTVPPVKALLSPVRLSAPAPALVKLPLPDIAFANAAALPWSMTSAALFTIAPLPKLAAVPTSVPPSIAVPPV